MLRLYIFSVNIVFIGAFFSMPENLFAFFRFFGGGITGSRLLLIFLRGNQRLDLFDKLRSAVEHSGYFGNRVGRRRSGINVQHFHITGRRNDKKSNGRNCETGCSTPAEVVAGGCFSSSCLSLLVSLPCLLCWLF